VNRCVPFNAHLALCIDNDIDEARNFSTCDVKALRQFRIKKNFCDEAKSGGAGSGFDRDSRESGHRDSRSMSETRTSSAAIELFGTTADDVGSALASAIPPSQRSACRFGRDHRAALPQNGTNGVQKSFARAHAMAKRSRTTSDRASFRAIQSVRGRVSPCRCRSRPAEWPDRTKYFVGWP
jgi:hypothetical protein